MKYDLLWSLLILGLIPVAIWFDSAWLTGLMYALLCLAVVGCVGRGMEIAWLKSSRPQWLRECEMFRLEAEVLRLKGLKEPYRCRHCDSEVKAPLNYHEGPQDCGIERKAP